MIISSFLVELCPPQKMEHPSSQQSRSATCGLLPADQVAGKRLLVIGSSSFKDYVWDAVAEMGIEVRISTCRLVMVWGGDEIFCL